MIVMTPLEQAVVAWTRNPDDANRRQMQYDDARTLGETGVFSNGNIALITGLDATTVGTLTGKKDKTGGRLNPETLSFILDLRIDWVRNHRIDQATLAAATNGTSCAMVAKLTGIGRSTLYQKTKEVPF